MSNFKNMEHDSVFYAGLPKQTMKIGQDVIVPFSLTPTTFKNNIEMDYALRAIRFLPGKVTYVGHTNRFAVVEVHCSNGNKFKEGYFIEDLLRAEEIYNNRRRKKQHEQSETQRNQRAG